MYVSLHWTRARRFANSLTAGSRERIPSCGQLVPCGAPPGFPVTGLWKAAPPVWSVPSAPAGPPRRESWRGQSGFVPALVAPTPAPLCKQVCGRAPGKDSRPVRSSFPSPGLSDLQIPRFCYLAISPLANCWKLGDQERGEGWDSVPPLSSRWTRGALSFLGPRSWNFAPVGSRGSRTPAFRDSPRGPRSDVRGRHIFSGSWLPRGVGEQLVSRGESAAPRQERLERFSPGKFVRPGRQGGGSTGRAPRLSSQGRAGCSASPGRPAGVEGREPPSETASSACLGPRSRRDAAVGLRGARNTPLSCGRGRRGAPLEPCAWPLFPVGRRCGPSCWRQDPPGCPSERGSSLPA